MGGGVRWGQVEGSQAGRLPWHDHTQNPIDCHGKYGLESWTVARTRRRSSNPNQASFLLPPGPHDEAWLAR